MGLQGSCRLRLGVIEKVDAKDGVLRVRFAGKIAAFELGKSADVWAQRIARPQGIVDKVGIKPGQRDQNAPPVPFKHVRW